MLQELDSVSSASKESISSISTHDDRDTTSINEHRYNKPRSYTHIERAIFKSRKIQNPKSEHLYNIRTLHRIMCDLDSVSSVPNEITTIKNLPGQLVKFNCVYLEKPTCENKTSTTSRNSVNQLATFVICTAVGSVTKYAPDHVVNGRDMLIHKKEMGKYYAFWERRIEQHFKENIYENKKSSNHKYKVGEKTLVITKQTSAEKSESILRTTKAFFEIIKVYENDTTKIKRNHSKRSNISEE